MSEPSLNPNLTRALEQARTELDGAAAPSVDAATLAAVEERLEAPLAWSRWVVPAGGVAAVSLLGVLVFALSGERALTYAVERARTEGSGYLATTEHEGGTMRFSDGSELRLDASSRVHVAETTRNGARVQVVSGLARVFVRHRANTRWLVEPGPFVVHVTGTRFTASWSPRDEEAVVELEEGQVRIDGPGLAEPVVLAPGQRFSAHVKPEGVQVELTSGERPAPRSPAVTSPPTPAEEPRPLAAVKPPLARPAPARSDWKGWARMGAFERIVEEAEHVGLAATLKQRSAEDLLVLADAARYLRRPELARAVLTELSTGPASQVSAVAAYRMGQLTEAVDPLAADRWYASALERDSEGALAAEALGRRLLLGLMHHQPNTRALADEYLRRFPEGSAASVARATLEQP